VDLINVAHHIKAEQEARASQRK